MKKKTLLSLSILCLLMFTLFPFSVEAAEQSMPLKAEVPSTHKVAIEVGSGGAVEIDGVGYTGKTMVAVERLKAQSYKLIPDSGYEVNKVLYGGTDVTPQVKNLIFTAEEINNEGNQLQVTFKKGSLGPDPLPKPDEGGTGGSETPGAAGTSKTGDDNHHRLFLIMAIASGTLVVMGMTAAKKRRA
ncbi:MAG: hypothetical protein RR626_07195 [Anaerovoracaceae bacterium]